MQLKQLVVRRPAGRFARRLESRPLALHEFCAGGGNALGAFMEKSLLVLLPFPIRIVGRFLHFDPP